jgi:Uma2 family endonuclease
MLFDANALVTRLAVNQRGRYGESAVHDCSAKVYSEPVAHAASDLPRRRRLTVAEYRRMAEVGILGPDERVELIDGEIIDMAPPGSLHAAGVHRLTEIFIRTLATRATVLAQNPVLLGEHSQPQPDLALLKRREDFYGEEHPRAVDVLLVVEIADTSLSFDRETKSRLYARHGIGEFWLVDLRGRRLVRHRLPQQGSYKFVDEADLETPVEAEALPGAPFDLRRLFG